MTKSRKVRKPKSLRWYKERIKSLEGMLRGAQKRAEVWEKRYRKVVYGEKP